MIEPRDISQYTFPPSCYVRRGTVTVNGRTEQVILLISDEVQVAFPIPLLNIDKMVAQLYTQRALAAAQDRPVAPDDLMTLQ